LLSWIISNNFYTLPFNPKTLVQKKTKLKIKEK
jgi:hypothetical protein